MIIKFVTILVVDLARYQTSSGTVYIVKKKFLKERRREEGGGEKAKKVARKEDLKEREKINLEEDIDSIEEEDKLNKIMKRKKAKLKSLKRKNMMKKNIFLFLMKKKSQFIHNNLKRIQVLEVRKEY